MFAASDAQQKSLQSLNDQELAYKVILLHCSRIHTSARTSAGILWNRVDAGKNVFFGLIMNDTSMITDPVGGRGEQKQ